MSIFDAVRADAVCASLRTLPPLRAVVLDANFSAECIGAVANWTTANGVPLWFEPTSVAKCLKVRLARNRADALCGYLRAQILPYLSHCTVVSPNKAELRALAAALDASFASKSEPLSSRSSSARSHCVSSGVEQQCRLLMKHGCGAVIATLGPSSRDCRLSRFSRTPQARKAPFAHGPGAATRWPSCAPTRRRRLLPTSVARHRCASRAM